MTQNVQCMGRNCEQPDQEFCSPEKLFKLHLEAEDVRLRNRYLAIWMLMDGKSREFVMEQFNIQWTTLQKWVRLWNKGGPERLKLGKITGRPTKMTDEAKDFIVKSIEFTHPETGEKVTGLSISANLKKISNRPEHKQCLCSSEKVGLQQDTAKNGSGKARRRGCSGIQD